MQFNVGNQEQIECMRTLNYRTESNMLLTAFGQPNLKLKVQTVTMRDGVDLLKLTECFNFNFLRFPVG